MQRGELSGAGMVKVGPCGPCGACGASTIEGVNSYWLVVFLEHDWLMNFHILGISSSQLTNSYFSKGLVNHQPAYRWHPTLLEVFQWIMNAWTNTNQPVWSHHLLQIVQMVDCSYYSWGCHRNGSENWKSWPWLVIVSKSVPMWRSIQGLEGWDYPSLDMFIHVMD